MSQEKIGANVAGMTSEIEEILLDFCICIQGKQSPEVHELAIARAAQCLAANPGNFRHSIPFTERECVQKIMKILNARENVDGFNVAGKFYAIYGRFLQIKFDPYLRHSLLSYLLSLADKSVEWSSTNGDSSPSSITTFDRESDNLRQVLSSRTSASTFRSSSNGSSTAYASSKQNGNGNGNGSGVANGGSVYSYDASQSSLGLGQQPMPNYLSIIEAQKNPEVMQDIVTNAVYSFTGVQGKYLKKDIVSGRFKLDPLNIKALTIGQAGMLVRLSELGYYHDRVAKFADVTTGFNAMGCMGQALISKLKEELSDFHGQVSVLHDELNRHREARLSGDGGGGADGNELTLFKLLAWYMKPLHRMQWLTKIADACLMKKGGDLASTVYDLLDNGNSMVRELVNQLMTAICGPLVRMISTWMLEGGICDLYGEFFVESLSEVGPDRLWHDKFRLRWAMLPKFVPLELANKILKTGKCISFLREICETQELVKSRDQLKQIMDNNVAHIFSYVPDTSWHAAVETCYQQTSKHVLDIMVGPHKLLDHLQGMRRYLLLGQGDFVSILIENMKDELERPGVDIYAHDLSAMLDAALRCTNAQYDDPDILNHLDVVVQRPFPGDHGWDIISLQYIVHGPLATMLEPTMPVYKTLFKPLWRMKHMEFVLSKKIWKEQMGNAKTLHSMKSEIGKPSHRLYLFTSEIMHFIHQIQYYVLFEVIECNWVELQKKMQQATALDDILDAHEKFLRTITLGCFVNTKSDMKNLEKVYENISALENWQSLFYKDCFKELGARQELANIVEQSEREGGFGLTNELILQRDHERKIFAEQVEIACHGLECIASDYEKAVSSFLMTLNSSHDPNLQLFGTRLDFNEYYKNRDTNLSKPLTFEHMRMSNVFSQNNRNSRFVIHSPATISKE
ncbi:gamma-tubulin complex component 3 [Drosophila gunungcola]|uniref:gamma-tubulin complex component 3 n=1 Tax=Drosophila gunungcola TaxID=103775 RepID=UPI0022E858B6|nr:gamma-tubulin complex component 3 [Drosophila gunungcola]